MFHFGISQNDLLVYEVIENITQVYCVQWLFVNMFVVVIRDYDYGLEFASIM